MEEQMKDTQFEESVSETQLESVSAGKDPTDSNSGIADEDVSAVVEDEAGNKGIFFFKKKKKYHHGHHGHHH